MGSSVPAWPTLRVPASRRVRATTSWLVQPAGLSTTTSPSRATSVLDARCAVVGRRPGAGARSGLRARIEVLVLVLGPPVRVGLTGVRGGGGEGRDLGVPGGCLAEQGLEVLGGLGNRVGDELQGRGQPDPGLL